MKTAKDLHRSFARCDSIKSVAKQITGGTEIHSAEELAGYYAYDAARGQGDLSDFSLEAYLDAVEEAGAKFKYAEALDFAKYLAEQ